MTLDPQFIGGLPPVDSESLATYLAANGWVSEPSSSPFAKIWYRPNQPNDTTDLIVPTQDDVADFRVRISEIFRSLQKIESRPEELIARDVIVSSCDVVRLRRPVVSDREDSIPLKDGTFVVQKCHSLSNSEVMALAEQAARRPKPPSLKEQALEELGKISISPELGITYSALDTIRRAVESLPDYQHPL